MEESIVFRKFSSREAAEDLRLILESHGITATLSNEQNEYVHIQLGSLTKSDYEVQIKPGDIPKAEAALSANLNDDVARVTKDYYLYEYSNNELFEILEKFDEWSDFDYEIAQKILRERGKIVDKETLSSLKYKRLDTLAQPEEVGVYLLYLGYSTAILFGFFGIIFGYVIMTGTKVLPDGNRVFTYTAKGRAHGKTIFYLALIVSGITILSAIIRGYYMYN